MLRFTLTITWSNNGVDFSESHKGVLAGINVNGDPWVRPPQSNPQFQTTAWSETLKQAIIDGLEKHNLLKDLETPWKAEEDDSVIEL